MSNIMKDIYLKGQAALEEDYASQEHLKKDVFRGGNTGAVIDGESTGSCPRLMHLRSRHSWQPPRESADSQPDGIDRREIMFGKGHMNEVFNLQKFEAGLKDDPELFILSEDDIPIRAELEGDVVITGRPDQVLVRQVDLANLPPCPILPMPDNTNFCVPLHLIEHKAICGTSMAVSAINNQPKLAHMLQGMFYAYHLGLKEGTLIYTSSDYRKVDFFSEPACPKPGMPNSDKISYHYYEAVATSHPSSKKGWTRNRVSKDRWTELGLDSFNVTTYNKKGVAKTVLVAKAQSSVANILPFSMWFDMRWEDDILMWKEVDDTVWWDTKVSITDVHNQFIRAAKMQERDELGDRPKALTCFIKDDKWSACGLCPLKEACDYAEEQKITSVKAWEQIVFDYFKEEE